MLRCTSNGKPCAGKCREINLRRDRTAHYVTQENKGLCCAAYGDERLRHNPRKPERFGTRLAI